MIDQLTKTKSASATLISLSDKQKNKVLTDLAAELKNQSTTILRENVIDLAKLEPSDPLYDRLLLTEERIMDIAEALLKVADFEDPVGKVLEEKTRPNGLVIKKVSVPLGVIAVIYEARPNVTVDVFGLTFKAGNACVLKGSSSAFYSNRILVDIIRSVLGKNGISRDAICLLNLDRNETKDLLKADEYVDVVIPRGGKNLIRSVRDNATIPVIETGAGVVHTYFSENGDLQKGAAVILNAKTRRVSVCNALDTLIIHRDRLNELPKITEKMAEKKVEIFADWDAYDILKESYPGELLHEAKDEHFGTEFLSLKMSIKTVGEFEEALEHIQRFSSKHSEAIISEDQVEIDEFLKRVDAAAVYANASTAFTDGGEFGLGAEIGISTQKLHARGPMGLTELTSYKWVITGDGQVRR